LIPYFKKTLKASLTSVRHTRFVAILVVEVFSTNRHCNLEFDFLSVDSRLVVVRRVCIVLTYREILVKIETLYYLMPRGGSVILS